MLKLKFEVDDNTEITVILKAFVKHKIMVNGEEIAEKVNLKRFKAFHFKLADGREVSLTLKIIALLPELELKVNNELILPTNEYTIKTCKSCSTVNKPNEKYCNKCSAELPASEMIYKPGKVVDTKVAIIAALMVLVFYAIVVFFYTKYQ